jgi:YD repeat-containing protein
MNVARNPFRSYCLLVVAAYALLGAAVSSGADIPNYYAEPGIMSGREYVKHSATEFIDPFSGIIHLRYVDISIPGPGGFDLVVQRSYNTSANGAYDASALGAGWTMHFGRFLRSSTFDPCTPKLQTDPTDNPVLELPDGSRHVFYHAQSSDPTGPLFLTSDRWKADCAANGSGLIVTSPDGIQYTMTRREDGAPNWYVSEIRDRNNNWISIVYRDLYTLVLIDSVTTSDGRGLSFSYQQEGSSNTVRLGSITAKYGPSPAQWKTWQYFYTDIPSGFGAHHLVRVLRPDGSEWKYDYYPYNASNTTGAYAIRSIVSPYGGTTSYTYQAVDFDGALAVISYFNNAIRTKTVSSSTSSSETWTYTFQPAAADGALDQTIIDASYGRTIYRHYGIRSAMPGNGLLWRIGLLVEKDSGGVQLEKYEWGSQQISTEKRFLWVTYAHWDYGIFVPVMTKKTVTRNGTPYVTTYANFDAYGNPRTITETGNATRSRSLTYLNSTSKWIIRQVKDETITGAGSINRTFDTKGNLLSKSEYGVTTNFTYTSQGDIETRTNARQKVWRFSDYFRGAPRREDWPEGVVITRSVNESGTVASETDGRRNTTYYSYDNMNRLSAVQTPRTDDSDVAITWNVSGKTKTVTRGNYRQQTDFDGFGRPVLITTWDARSPSDQVRRKIVYDERGLKTFESYPGSSLINSSLDIGDKFGRDVLGRVTDVWHMNSPSTSSSSQKLTYSAGNQVTVRDEDGHNTTHTYRSYGDPDEMFLTRVDAPGQSTILDKNVLGQLTGVTQGSLIRNYDYYPTTFLKSVTNPETGTTSFGRDEVGNMISRQVGTSGTTIFSYDGLDRLKNIDYPGVTPDVSYQYDNNGNVEILDNGVARRVNTYDVNNNIKTESLSVNGLTYASSYDYDTLDHLSTITYPSLRQVSYNPDIHGRPTTVLPFVTSVSHHPNGIPSQMQFANGQVTYQGINSRQWVGSILTQKTGAGSLVNLGYGYDGRGNVTSVTNGLDPTDSKSLTYDGTGRLRTAGSAIIDYDTADNITSMTTSAGALTYTYDSNNRLASVTGRNNASYGYDSYGNVGYRGGEAIYGYDDASTLRSFIPKPMMCIPEQTCPQLGYFYDYDGRNQRACAFYGRTSGVAPACTATGINATHFFYSDSGLLLGEYYASGLWKKEYAYLGNKLIAMISNDPDAPTSLVTPTIHSNGSFTITWPVATGGVTSYELYQATNSTFSNAVLVYSGTSTSATFSGLAPGTYYHRVRACNSTTCSTYTIASVGTTIVKPNGDLNGDGMVDGRDILIAQRILTGLTPVSDSYLVYGDVAPLANGVPAPDNQFTPADALVIERKAMGLVSY